MSPKGGQSARLLCAELRPEAAAMGLPVREEVLDMVSVARLDDFGMTSCFPQSCARGLPTNLIEACKV